MTLWPLGFSTNTVTFKTVLSVDDFLQRCVETLVRRVTSSYSMMLQVEGHVWMSSVESYVLLTRGDLVTSAATDEQKSG